MNMTGWSVGLLVVLSACQPASRAGKTPHGVWEGTQPAYPMRDAMGAPRLVNGQTIRVAGSLYTFEVGDDGWVACTQVHDDGRRFQLTGQWAGELDSAGRWVVRTALDDGYTDGLRPFTLVLGAGDGTGVCHPPHPEPAFEVKRRPSAD